MKRIFTVLLVLLLLTGCGKTAQTESTVTSVSETDPQIQETVPLFAPEPDALVRVLDYLPGCRQFLPYASEDNLTETVIYDFYDAYLRYGTVKKLMLAAQELQQQGYHLLIWDGFRPMEAQQTLQQIRPDDTADPETGIHDHSRGNTVDLTLMDSDGVLVEMPTGFDEFTPKADREYSDCTEAAAANAKLLETVMEKYGFEGCGEEWWHFTDTQEYPAAEDFRPVKPCWYQTKQAASLTAGTEQDAAVLAELPAGEEILLLAHAGAYLLVEYQGQRGYIPAEQAEKIVFTGEASPEIWEANCSSYISLRSRPNVGAPLVTTVSNGESFKLLSWDRSFARIRYQEQEGYVLSRYVWPRSPLWSGSVLKRVPLTDRYSYEQLLLNLDAMVQDYPDLLEKDTIGQSELGRDIPVLRIGSADAEHHVLLQGAIHGREHMTAWLLMAMTDYWLENGMEQLVENTCFHIIPMVNPDGVELSQTGNLPQSALQVYYDDYAQGFAGENAIEYAAMWKANAMGIDLNRNFPAQWEGISVHRTIPSSELFQGYEPFTAAESCALRDYRLAWEWDATISFHSAGSLIFSEFGTREPVNADSRSLAQAVAAVNGYTVASSIGMTGGGYKDWVMEELGIPSLTLEIGCNGAVLEYRELFSTFSRNYNILWAVNRWLEGR